ncbi:MAG: phosphoribosylanthranilate isomerase [Actinomycetota bacterium]|nr:phosphoribosylanthranilate isomerase [Actinomycetota bacterium]
MADYYLADTYSKNSYGGSGKTFDWKIVSGLNMKEKLIIAGGLGPDNVAEAINMVDPFGVDASSGLELPGGGKDKEKVKKFITLARGKGGYYG